MLLTPPVITMIVHKMFILLLHILVYFMLVKGESGRERVCYLSACFPNTQNTKITLLSYSKECVCKQVKYI